MKKLSKIGVFFTIIFLLLTNVTLCDNIFLNSSNINDNWFITFVSNPIISGALIIIAIVGLIIELFIFNYGIAGLFSTISIIIFFVGNIYTGYSSILSLLLFIVGCVFIVLELFIPGFGVLGILGAILFVIGIMTSISNIFIGLVSITIALLISILLFIYIFRKGNTNKFVKKIILEKEIQSTSSRDYKFLESKGGITATPLRPSGIILVDGNKYDAITEGEFLEKNTSIIVFKTEGFKIIVRRQVL